jgi:hypothetical protein
MEIEDDTCPTVKNFNSQPNNAEFLHFCDMIQVAVF